MRFPSAALAHSGSVLLLEPVENRIEQADILVFGGTKPAGGNWSSIFVVRLAGDGPLRSCTATKVGPSVLLTAAHCIDQGDDKPFRSLSLKPLPGSNDAVQFTCSRMTGTSSHSIATTRRARRSTMPCAGCRKAAVRRCIGSNNFRSNVSICHHSTKAHRCS